MISQTEQVLARNLRIVLSTIPIGGSIQESNEFRDALSGLCRFVDQVVCEVYPEWTDSLDGIYPVFARKTAELEAEIGGMCWILAGHDYSTILHVQLEAAPDRDEIVWFECKLGEHGPDGMIKWRDDSFGRMTVTERLDTAEWVYSVGFGERTSAKQK